MTHRCGRRVAAAGLAIALVAAAASCNRGGEASPTNSPSGGPVATEPGGSVSFPLPEDTAGAVKLAGLSLLPQEATEYDVRAHLDVVVDGKAVAVPADIGIDVESKQLSPLHTHDATGVVHIAAPKADTFRVGQLFQEWGVTLTKTCLGSYCADDTHQLLGFDDGQLVPDPASIPFDDQAEIVIWFGPKGTNPPVPTTYAFPPA